MVVEFIQRREGFNPHLNRGNAVEQLRILADEVVQREDLIDNPRTPVLREMSSRYSMQNEFGCLLFHTKVSARSPDVTVEDVNRVDQSVREKILNEINEVRKYLKEKRLIRVDRSIGTSKRFSLKATAVVSESYPHLALMFQMNYFPTQEDKISDIVTLDIPEWPRKIIYVDPKENINLILGTDYYGELKMSALRLAMNIARESGLGLGVHAGGKVFKFSKDGRTVEKGALVFGLSGTGKTTITVSDHGITPPDTVLVRQDDIMILFRDGYAAGTEMNLYPKTDSINTLPELKSAAIQRDSILENVSVKEGKVDFDDTAFSTNGRAIALRSQVRTVDDKVDIKRIDFMFFLTRRNDQPVAGRLKSKEQAVAYFMLGESVMTSAGTTNKELVGRAIRVPGFDPFIIEPRWISGVRLLEILGVAHDITAYILNTGHVGVNKIPPAVTKAVVLAIAKGEGRWEYNEDLKYDVLTEAPGLDLKGFDVKTNFGDKYSYMMNDLREERRRYLANTFPELVFLTSYL
jgi:phosphoenolpyruvate carboxykinase (ATP)